MQTAKKPWPLDNVIAPFLRGIGLAIMVIYTVVFAWWLDPWLQRKVDRTLLNDVQLYLDFLFPEAEVVKTHRAGSRFGYAVVEIHWRNLIFIIACRSRDLNISIGPRHAPNELSEFGPAVAALEGRHFSERYFVRGLSDAAALLRPRLELLNSAFSEQEYPRTRDRI